MPSAGPSSCVNMSTRPPADPTVHSVLTSDVINEVLVSVPCRCIVITNADGGRLLPFHAKHGRMVEWKITRHQRLHIGIPAWLLQ